MFQSGFLGTDAGFITDLTLLAEIIFFIAICVGIVAQRRGRYKLHDWIQTPVVVLNLLLIIFVMVTSFAGQRVISTLPQRPGDAYYLVVAMHALLGLIAEGLAIYALLAGHKILPRKIGQLRYWMWTTFAFWTAALIAGVATYYIWYMQAPDPVAAVPVADVVEGEAETAVTPTTTQAFLQNFAFAPTDLTITAGTEVVWLNQDGAPHNITFVDGSVASENFFQSETFATTFAEPGVYQIYCTLHGSADGSGMATTVTVLEDNAENAAVVAVAPTPNSVPPTPTPAPTVPPPPVELLEAEASAQTVVGLVSFFDTIAPSDSVAVLLSSITAPESGTTLEVWLTDSQSNTVFPLGQVLPDANGRITLQFTDADGRNLLGRYDGFQITQEPQFDDDPTTGTNRGERSTSSRSTLSHSGSSPWSAATRHRHLVWVPAIRRKSCCATPRLCKPPTSCSASPMRSATPSISSTCWQGHRGNILVIWMGYTAYKIQEMALAFCPT